MSEGDVWAAHSRSVNRVGPCRTRPPRLRPRRRSSSLQGDARRVECLSLVGQVHASPFVAGAGCGVAPGMSWKRGGGTVVEVPGGTGVDGLVAAAAVDAALPDEVGPVGTGLLMCAAVTGCVVGGVAGGAVAARGGR
jgi:hypothetical protein